MLHFFGYLRASAQSSWSTHLFWGGCCCFDFEIIDKFLDSSFCISHFHQLSPNTGRLCNLRWCKQSDRSKLKPNRGVHPVGTVYCSLAKYSCMPLVNQQ